MVYLTLPKPEGLRASKHHFHMYLKQPVMGGLHNCLLSTDVETEAES